MQNLLWSIAGKVVSMLSGLLVGIIVARYLGPEHYGLLNYVISYVFLFMTFASFGLDAIEIREEARQQVPYTTVIGTAFGLKAAFGLLFMVLVIATSWAMEADGYTTLLVAIYSLTIVLNSFSVVRNYFTAIVKNKYIVQAEISRTLIGIVIKIALLLMHASLTWFLAAYMFDFLLLASGYCISYRSQIGSMRQWRFDPEYARFLLRESFPLLLTNAAVIVYQRIDQVMIGQMIDNRSVGYFAVASRFVELLAFIPIMLAQTITPVLVRIREEDSHNHTNRYSAKSQQFMNLSLWLSIFISAVTSAIAYWLIRYTFGTAYLPAVAVLQIMAFKTASVALSNTAGTMLVTEGLQRFAILRDGFGCIVCVALNYILLPRYGIVAAAFVAIASNVAAGYLADAFIPAYRHLFVSQTKALLFGWHDIIHLKSVIANK